MVSFGNCRRGYSQIARAGRTAHSRRTYGKRQRNSLIQSIYQRPTLGLPATHTWDASHGALGGRVPHLGKQAFSHGRNRLRKHGRKAYGCALNSHSPIFGIQFPMSCLLPIFAPDFTKNDKYANECLLPTVGCRLAMDMRLCGRCLGSREPDLYLAHRRAWAKPILHQSCIRRERGRHCGS